MRRLLLLTALLSLLTGCGLGQGDFAFGQPADPADATRTIEIRTDDVVVFYPAEVTVTPGETVTFSISNEDDILHEFVIGDATAQEKHGQEIMELSAERRGPEKHEGADAVSVPVGETAELAWTFDGETDGLFYGCHVPGHYEAGMVGNLLVEG